MRGETASLPLLPKDPFSHDVSCSMAFGRVSLKLKTHLVVTGVVKDLADVVTVDDTGL